MIAAAAQGSSTYSFALAIGNAARDGAGMDLRLRPYDGTRQASTFVNEGEVDFWLENAIAICQAHLGEGKFTDHQLGELQPAANLTTITAPTEVLQYDYFVYRHADEAGANVAALLKAMAVGKAAWVDPVAGLVWFEQQAMSVDIGVPYYPAALAYFKEQGQTP